MVESVGDAVARWIAAHADRPELVHLERRPARPARGAPTPADLPDSVARLIPPTGLWSHQRAAIDLLRSGRSIVLATPTASGKSLAYQIPIAEAAVQPIRPGTSLLVFPTKALAQDQLRSMTEMGLPDVVAATYDGDCSPEERVWVRNHANVILTNPEMLHHGMLPNHRRWGLFLSRLRYVVVDELHVLRGVFGSHSGHVLRRLARLAHHYGAEPTFAFCSATIGEPARLASELLGVEVDEIDSDGSPSAERAIAMWDPQAAERPVSPTTAAAQIAASLVDSGLRTLVFCRSRRGTELVAQSLRRRIRDGDERVRAYRSGYLSSERREIEDDLFSGRLDAVVATNALELGVDIGGLDAVVLCGYPGTVTSMWQQIGRAGRAGDASIAIVVAGEDQLDRWVMDHPTETLRRPPERAVTNPSNPLVADAHLACAAHELPLSRVDERYWPDQLDDAVRRGVLGEWMSLRRRRGGDVAAVFAGRAWPASEISLRSSSRGELRILADDDEPVGTIDEARAADQAHPGAIYLHQARPWQVTDLDVAHHLVRVVPSDGETYTQTRSDTTIRLLREDARRDVGRSGLHLGTVEVTRRVTGYQVKRVSDHHTLERHELDLPPTVLLTRAFWYTFGLEVFDDAGIVFGAVGPSLHAAEHAGIGMLPLFAICDRWDVGGISTEWQADTGLPTIVIYDGYPGGIGIAELGWESADRHLDATLGVIERCECESGCPSCVQSPKCGNWNDALDKDGAIRLLRTSLGDGRR
jgi:DEAD/DEAH box helicase domain-containing protein